MTKVGRYFFNIALGLDQFGNTLWGGSPDECISSRLGRIKTANGGKIPWSRPWAKMIDAGLNVIQRDHSINAIEYDEYLEIQNESIWDGNYLPQKPMKKERPL